MKNKKILSFVLTAALVMAYAVPSLAVDNPNVITDLSSDSTTEIVVKADITKSSTTGSTSDVYRASVAWETPELTATQSADVGGYVWDAENTKYVKQSGTTSNSGITSASEGVVKITVTNMSNKSIFYKITEADQNNYVLSHTAVTEGVMKASTEIIAADEPDQTGGARESMSNGSTNETALTGAAVSGGEQTDTIKITSAPHMSSSQNDVDVAKYTVTISKAAIQ